MEKYFGKLPCKLSTKAIINLENDVKKSVLTLIASDDAPSLKTLLTIVYHSCKAVDKSITFDDVIDEFDAIEIGYKGLIEFVAELYKASGLIPETSGENSGN